MNQEEPKPDIGDFDNYLIEYGKGITNLTIAARLIRETREDTLANEFLGSGVEHLILSRFPELGEYAGVILQTQMSENILPEHFPSFIRFIADQNRDHAWESCNRAALLLSESCGRAGLHLFAEGGLDPEFKPFKEYLEHRKQLVRDRHGNVTSPEYIREFLSQE